MCAGQEIHRVVLILVFESNHARGLQTWLQRVEDRTLREVVLGMVVEDK